MDFDAVFEPAHFAGLALRNRIARAPVYEKLADTEGLATEDLTSHYKAISEGGAGLIITGASFVHESGRYRVKQISVHSERCIPGLGSIASAIKKGGAASVLQLAHGGPLCPPRLIGSQSLTTSNMQDGMIWELIDAFASSAWRARASGFDAVEVHAANKTLIHSFLSPLSNQRDDYWGGDLQRRTNLLEHVIKAIKDTAGSDFPVIARLGMDDCSYPEASMIAAIAQSSGADAIELAAGPYETYRRTDQPLIILKEHSRAIKSSIGMPVMLTGGLRGVSEIRDIINSGCADITGLGRPLIMEPGLPNMMMSGVLKSNCTSCNKCARLERHKSVECRHNVVINDKTV